MSRPLWLKSFLIGFGGALSAVGLALVIWTLLLTWERAQNGQLAWDCLHQPTCVQSFLAVVQQGRPTQKPAESPPKP